MKVQWKRALQTIVLGTSLLALAGCGSDNVMDIYSFGNQVIRSGQSEVTVALPYEMGKTSETTSVDGYPMDAYGSLSQHILISVEAVNRHRIKRCQRLHSLWIKRNLNMQNWVLLLMWNLSI